MEVPVTREEVVVERHPVDRRPTDRPISDKEEIEVDLTREEAVADKRTVVYEEVGVDKRVVQDTERVEADVQREVAHVKEEGDVDVRGDTRGTGPDSPRRS
jgi:uncharacterized protein (TIGR02271 family)